MKNRGSAIVEISLIMPIIFGVIFLLLMLYIDTIKDSQTCREGYSMLYTYYENNMADADNAGQIFVNNTKSDSTEQANGTFAILDKHCCYEKNEHIFMREIDLSSSRLRRWQFYGDTIFE